jgi:hypothetical protein
MKSLTGQTILKPFYQKFLKEVIDMNDRIKEVLTSVLNRFKTGDIPQAIAYSLFPIPDIPSAQWSLLNRILMFFSGTQDARGFRQWQEVNRYVKKGSKAFHILAPRYKAVEKEDEKEKGIALIGFLAVSVFRFEDTEGEPLSYQRLEPPALLLVQVAEDWGLSIKAIPGNYSYHGYYSGSEKEIALATKDEIVFFHELSHAAHEKVLGQLKAGQDWKQEIVAELSATVLCHLVGKKGDTYLGNSYRYIDNYAQQANLPPLKACLETMTDVERVLNLILKGGDENVSNTNNTAAIGQLA